MKIILAPNAFKESTTAPVAAEAMARGLRRAFPEAVLVRRPVADGGDGTAEALRLARGGEVHRHEVTGPLGDRIVAERTRLAPAPGEDGPTDVVEISSAAGLARVPRELRDPMRTTSRGLGELIEIARAEGARRVVVGLGGSATVDGGAGMLRAMGFLLLDERGEEIAPGGAGLVRLREVRWSDRWPRPGAPAGDAPELIVACDVRNRLLGPAGAAPVFGPQKGATPETIPQLEAGLARLALWLVTNGGEAANNVVDARGGGAAGGIAFALAGFLGARLRPGGELVLETIRFAEALEGADLVLTGEGRLDIQTLGGKAPAAVGRAAAAAGVPAIAFAGEVDPELGDSPENLGRAGLVAARSIVSGPMTREEAVAHGASLLETACLNLGRELVAMRPEATA